MKENSRMAREYRRLTANMNVLLVDKKFTLGH